MVTRQKQSKFIFVVGVWRSGTSLLYAMLNQHPHIALLYEAELFGLYPSAGDRVMPPDWTLRMEHYNQAISRHQLDAAALPLRPSRRAGALALAHAWGTRKNAKVIGDKSVACHMKLPQLAQIFPEADFIILWRNPLDTCRSVVNAGKKNSFFSRKGILTQTLFGAKQLAEGVLKLRSAGRRVHEVVYDDLIHDPKHELGKICEFVGLEFAPQMLDLAEADCSMLPPGDHHRPVRSGAVQKPQTRTEVLSPAFIAKGRRFAALWQALYPQLALVRALAKDNTGQMPGRFEKWKEQTACTFWDTLTALKHCILSLLPLAIWSHLRREKATSPKAGGPPATTPATDPPGLTGKPIRRAFIQPVHLLAHFVNNSSAETSLLSQFYQQWQLILANSLFLIAIIVFHFYCDRHLSFIPIYLIPCVWLTLQLGARWGSILAAFAATAPPWMHYLKDPVFLSADVAIFNTVMRLILFQIIILLAAHIRPFHPLSLFKKAGATTNFIKSFARHWAVILTCCLLLTSVACLDVITSPQLNLLPIYLLPCVITTLAAGRSWGTAMAVAAAVIGPMMQRYEDAHYQYLAVEMWNTFMRFIIFQAIVVVLDRIQQESFNFLIGKLGGSTNLITPNKH